MSDERKMTAEEIFEACFNKALEKFGKDEMGEVTAHKQEYCSTVKSTTVSSSGRKDNEHNPYILAKTGEVQITDSVRPGKLNEKAYIADLEKRSGLSEKALDTLRKKHTEKESTPVRTMNVKLAPEFEVEFNKEVQDLIAKKKAKMAKARGFDTETPVNVDVEQVREKALKMVKGKQAN